MEERHFGAVWFIPGENNGKYPFCHSVYLEGPGILIDPASDRKRLEEIRDRHGVKAVWLSHWHEDHFTYLDLFEDVPLWISGADAPPLSDLEILLDEYGIGNEGQRQYWRQFMLEQFNFRPRRPHGFLQGGQQIRFGHLTVDLIATPGHTPGHLAFFFREPSVLFLGDYDLTRFGPWYGDVHSSIEDTIASLEQLRRIPARVLLTSHETGVFEQPLEAPWEPYERVIHEREGKLLQAMSRPKSLEDLVSRYLIYGRPREPRAFYEFCERALVVKHIERLERRGIALREHRCCVDPFDDLSYYLLAHTCSGTKRDD
jgi:glyoxylase-like metal-dependent hydrolase (beta-lactamase superfamily II)